MKHAMPFIKGVVVAIVVAYISDYGVHDLEWWVAIITLNGAANI